MNKTAADILRTAIASLESFAKMYRDQIAKAEEQIAHYGPRLVDCERDIVEIKTALDGMA